MAYGNNLSTRQLDRVIPQPRFNLSTCTGTGAEVEAWLRQNCVGGFCLGIMQKSDHLMCCRRTVGVGESPMPMFNEGEMMLSIEPFTIANYIDEATSTGFAYPNGTWVVFDLDTDALRCELKWGA